MQLNFIYVTPKVSRFHWNPVPVQIRLLLRKVSCTDRSQLEGAAVELRINSQSFPALLIALLSLREPYFNTSIDSILHTTLLLGYMMRKCESKKDTSIAAWKNSLIWCVEQSVRCHVLDKNEEKKELKTMKRLQKSFRDMWYSGFWSLTTLLHNAQMWI